MDIDWGCLLVTPIMYTYTSAYILKVYKEFRRKVLSEKNGVVC